MSLTDNLRLKCNTKKNKNIRLFAKFIALYFLINVCMLLYNKITINNSNKENYGTLKKLYIIKECISLTCLKILKRPIKRTT